MRCFSESKLSAASFIEVSYTSRVLAGSFCMLMWRGAARRDSGKAMQIADRSTSFIAKRMRSPLEICAMARAAARTLVVELHDKLDGAGTSGGPGADACDRAHGFCGWYCRLLRGGRLVG